MCMYVCWRSVPAPLAIISLEKLRHLNCCDSVSLLEISTEFHIFFLKSVSVANLQSNPETGFSFNAICRDATLIAHFTIIFEIRNFYIRASETAYINLL